MYFILFSVKGELKSLHRELKIITNKVNQIAAHLISEKDPVMLHVFPIMTETDLAIVESQLTDNSFSSRIVS